MDTKLSVCIPVYGVEKYIEKCVLSLFNQTMKEGIEFVFVNDCTKDKSIEILKEVCSRFPERKSQVKIIHHDKNRGLAAARLTGMRNASGEYIAHCDSDDWVEPEMYQSLYYTAKSNDADIVSCDFIVENNNGSEPVSLYYNNNKDLYLQDVISNKWGTVWKFIIKRHIFTNGKIIFDEKICHGEDYIYTVQCILASSSYVNLNKNYYHYNCQNISSMMKTPSLDSAKQQYAASIFVFDILKKRNLFDKYSQSILLRKLFARNRFLYFGVGKWREIFPEIKNRYWSLHQVQLLSKIQYWMLEHMPLRLADKLISLHTKMKF